MKTKIRFALAIISSLLVAWIIVGLSFHYYVLRPMPRQAPIRSDIGEHYSPGGLPYMVCEYRASNGFPHSERFINCKAAKLLKGFGTKHIYGLENE
jgi:hypothetical protein